VGLHIAWPIMSGVARLYRATFVRNVQIVAVVGSYGKSTTARAIAAVVGCDGARRHPGHMVLRLRRRDRLAVMEIGIDGPRQMARIARLVRPQVVVVTSIGSEHAALPTLDATRAEKADMVRALPPSGLAVLNGDDPNVAWMATQTHAAVRTFGLTPTNDVWASDVEPEWPQGTRFVVHANGERREVRTHLFGRHFVYPILAALTVALDRKLSLDDALSELEALAPTPRRLERQTLSNGALVLYDHYKSALETIDVALDVMAELPARRKIVVLGDVEEPPGSRDEVANMYERLGARVASIATKAVFVHIDVGPRPTYAEGARAHGLPQRAIVEVASALDAAHSIAPELGEGDVVLVKGMAQQRFDRLALALSGRRVRCDLAYCHARISCAACPMLERGWN
jgi:UDP-N-acetylmuramyl pentapeptide synthase